MNHLTAFPGLQQFLFDMPLYDVFALPATDAEKSSVADSPLDGYCVDCKRMSLFARHGKFDWDLAIRQRMTTDFVFSCRQNEKHLVRFVVMFGKGSVQKIGQYPSYATISQGMIRDYRKHLSPEDANELHKAIGLAAHDVGIGSFVYMRRIFERLIDRRFHEFKKQEGWSEEQSKGHMEDRITLLSKHLPDFMVKNKKLYSILSLGIHELNEKDCLKFFRVALNSILLILDDDRRRKEELEQRATLSRSIAEFERPASIER